MYKITMKVEGMRCGMCESHVNEVVRKNAQIKKVTSSHTKNQTVVISENNIDEQGVKEAIEAMGYKVLSIEKESYIKKGLFGIFKK